MSVVRHRFARFLLVGILNTAFGYAIFAILVLAGMATALALLVATLTGIIFNFVTVSRLVFSSRAPGGFPRFSFVYGIVYVFNLGGLYLLAAFGLGPLPAQALLLPFVAVLGYKLNSLFVFSAPGKKNI